MKGPVLVRVVCPTCGVWAEIPQVSVPTATCNNHERHHHPRGVTMLPADQVKGKR